MITPLIQTIGVRAQAMMHTADAVDRNHWWQRRVRLAPSLRQIASEMQTWAEQWASDLDQIKRMRESLDEIVRDTMTQADLAEAQAEWRRNAEIIRLRAKSGQEKTL